MTYDVYRYIFLGAAAGAGVMLVLSAVLFFALRIPRVISDLTGRTAKRAIEKIRQLNEQTGNKAHNSSAVNLERGNVTDKISGSGRLIRRSVPKYATGMITEKISTQTLYPASEGEQTTVLQTQEQTTVLDTCCGETEVLACTPEQPAQDITVEYEILFIHTDIVIAEEGQM